MMIRQHPHRFSACGGAKSAKVPFAKFSCVIPTQRRSATTTRAPKFLSDEQLNLIRQKKKSRLPQPSVLQPLTQPLEQQAPILTIDLKQNNITKLDNGVTVASQESYSSAAAFCVFFDHGVIDETDETHGYCHLIERLAYRVIAYFKLTFRVNYDKRF